MKKEGTVLVLILCFLAMPTGRVHVLAQEKHTEPEPKPATAAAQLKRAAEAAQAKRAIEAKRPQMPLEGTFKLLGSRLNLEYARGRLVKGAPYSATAITESTQTLSDGNQIIQRNEVVCYRDSEGRTRIEQTLKKIGKWVAEGNPKRIVTIADPVAGHYYYLDPSERKATEAPLQQKAANPAQLQELVQRQKLSWEKQKQIFEEQRVKQKQLFEEQWRQRKRALEEQSAKSGQASQEQLAKEKLRFEEQQAKKKQRFDEQWAKRKQRFEEQLTRRKEGSERSISEPRVEKSLTKPAAPSSPEEKRTVAAAESVKRTRTEPLGKQVIEGVEAEGTRVTRTIPAGEIGNTLPIYVVDENWYSRELHLPVMTRHHDPRSGETVFRLTNINRAEPARSLLEVPADYTMVENPRARSGYPPGGPRVEPKRATPNLPKPQPNRLEPVKPAAPNSLLNPTDLSWLDRARSDLINTTAVAR